MWSGWAFGCTGGLVVAGGIDGEFAEEFAGGGVDDADDADDADVQVVDEQDGVGSGVGSSDADVVEPSVHAQGDATGVIDAVVANASRTVLYVLRHLSSMS